MNDDLDQVEQAVHDTVQSGTDIYRQVRDITLKALTERELDTDNIKSVVESVLKGIESGLGTTYGSAEQSFKEAADAVDDALQKTVQASKPALEEAEANADVFSHHDLKQSGEDFKALENMFLETLEKTVRGSNEALSGIVRDFIAHARQNGTSVGNEVQTFITALDRLRHTGQDAVLSGAANSAATLAKIAGGILAGIADSLNPDKPER